MHYNGKCKGSREVEVKIKVRGASRGFPLGIACVTVEICGL